MQVSARRYVLSVATLALASLSGYCAPNADLPLSIAGLELVSTTRLSRTEFEYRYRATLTNTGVSLDRAVATARSLSSATIIVDSELTFTDISEDSSTLSWDTFTIRHDRTQPFDPGALVFAVDHPDALPSCETAAPSSAAILAAANTATDTNLLLEAWTDPEVFEEAVHVFETSLRCTIEDPPTSVQRGTAAQGEDTLNCYLEDLDYCGPGSPRGNPRVPDAVNRSCFDHDRCYTFRQSPLGCEFASPVADCCDAPLVSTCERLFNSEIGAPTISLVARGLLVCSMVRGLRSDDTRDSTARCANPACSSGSCQSEFGICADSSSCGDFSCGRDETLLACPADCGICGAISTTLRFEEGNPGIANDGVVIVSATGGYTPVPPIAMDRYADTGFILSVFSDQVYSDFYYLYEFITSGCSTTTYGYPQRDGLAVLFGSPEFVARNLVPCGIDVNQFGFLAFDGSAVHPVTEIDSITIEPLCNLDRSCIPPESPVVCPIDCPR